MQMVKIHIPEQPDSAKAFVEMVRRGRVDCYRDEIYIVPESAMELLDRLGVTYQELGREGLGYAEKALRDSIAAQV